VVVGGGCSGAQTAEYLARRGHQVTIVEKGEVIAAEAPFDEGVLLLGRLAGLGVKTIKGAAVKGFGPHSVAIERHGKTSVLPCDTAVLCLGSYPSDGIENEIKPLVKKMKVVGDALEPRRVTDAMAEGALAALAL
jgi:thioredoxin reductase